MLPFTVCEPDFCVGDLRLEDPISAEQALREIGNLLATNDAEVLLGRDPAHVVAAVRRLASVDTGWVNLAVNDEPDGDATYEVRLHDGSTLCNVLYDPDRLCWRWQCATVPGQVIAWRQSQSNSLRSFSMENQYGQG